ncbi:hypothetical protein N7462_007975 [Penicillium macrosclerotiorum]|uniref:uncharacterized protein n=1 Tax=Penicillium macrosclerotiorum TaxID=303699 RepID=UPI002547C306|nr:uncharacterized protein N7462_007975 [Penicillium macrosclerotiorum]KAJ5679731.1 hypothetical protein N7462_007975 [Penicillium macrosclerotiorum]
MLPRARGALSRALRLNGLRSHPKSCPHELAYTLHPLFSFTQSPWPSALRYPVPSSRHHFSTTRFQRQQSKPDNLTDLLPICCPGCGAFSQTIEPDEPGYYSTKRKETRKLLASKDMLAYTTDLAGAENVKSKANASEGDVHDTIEAIEPLEQAGAPRPIQSGALLDDSTEPSCHGLQPQARVSHVCDRCHDLIHHNRAIAAPKPSVHSIRDFVNESPYKDNRIYHILDAADFPMSLIPRIHWALFAQEQRSKNRRAANEKYSRGRKLPTISFIITRSDLLAATKEQVDSKMEYVRSVLRTALGKAGKDVRLGNVHMISAHRGWWTKQLKEEIKDHGGGIWVVGKANVGKSSFIEACFPKDSRRLENVAEWIEQRLQNNEQQTPVFDPDSLLPPAPREDQFPILPVVSSLPGTTVSPIRIPFGRGKGEMIDLPGLERSELEDFVCDEHKRDLIMTKRIKPKRCIIKPGQSLLLGGGLVRITATNPTDTILAACFIPIETHVTKTEKAIEMQTEQRPYPGTILMRQGTGFSMASAGNFDLEWDTTASNLPATVAKAVKDKGIPIPTLPYRVMSADILIEGCGWIEISIQIRTKRNPNAHSPQFPQVEVVSPNGKYVGIRPPIECWNFIAEKLKADKRKRPRSRFRYS